MKKKVLIVSAILITLGATMPACAADLSARRYTKAPAVAAPIYNWTGFYIGGHIGRAFNRDNSLPGHQSPTKEQLLAGAEIRRDSAITPDPVLEHSYDAPARANKHTHGI